MLLAFAILPRTDLLPPPPPAEKASARQDQAGDSKERGRAAGVLTASMTKEKHASGYNSGDLLSPPPPFSGFNFFSSVETRLRNSFMTL
jgi:hypothetical protein